MTQEERIRELEKKVAALEEAAQPKNRFNEVLDIMADIFKKIGDSDDR